MVAELDAELSGLALDVKPPTQRASRIVALSVYAILVLTWWRVVGIPNDSLTVFLFLWVGTIAWNIDAPPRYHLNFLRDWWLPVALRRARHPRALDDADRRRPV
ncbi:MAG: hypothetical protein WKF79_14415, partial [Nocardioides sp.]